MSPARELPLPLPRDSVAAELATIAGMADVAANCARRAAEAAIAGEADMARSLIASAAWRLADAGALLAQLAGQLDLSGPGLTEPTGRNAMLRKAGQ